jgi:nucleoside-diphosphate-sugar epimerase
MKIVITGGTGFIGSRLALACHRQGHAVRVLGLANNSWEADTRRLLENEGIEAADGAVTDRQRMFELLEGADIVFHLAAAQHEANVPDQRFWDVNVIGTRNVLDAAVAAGAKRFVHGSTIGVYGSATDCALSEGSPLRPDNIYGVTKLEGEELALSFKDRLPVTVVRISETYGPGDRRLLKLFKSAKRKAVLLLGDGKNVHHPIYIQDLIDGLLLAAACETAIGKVFVLAGKEPVSTKTMMEVIAENMGDGAHMVRVPLTPFLAAATIMSKTLGPLGIQPPLHPRRMDFFRKSFYLSGDLARETLGFAPRHSFTEGVRETARWYKEMGYI